MRENQPKFLPSYVSKTSITFGNIDLVRTNVQCGFYLGDNEHAYLQPR